MQRWLLRTAILYAVLLPLVLFYVGIFVFNRFDGAVAQRNDASVLIGELTSRGRSTGMRPTRFSQRMSPNKSAADRSFDPLSDQIYFYLGTEPVEFQKGSVVYEMKTLEQSQPTPVFDLPIDLWPSQKHRFYDEVQGR